jgi:hypothetical protein
MLGDFAGAMCKHSIPGKAVYGKSNRLTSVPAEIPPNRRIYVAIFLLMLIVAGVACYIGWHDATRWRIRNVTSRKLIPRLYGLMEKGNLSQVRF